MLNLAMQSSEAIRHCHEDRNIAHGNLTVENWKVNMTKHQLLLVGDLYAGYFKGSKTFTSDIYELGMLWAQLIKGSPYKASAEGFSSTLGK